MSQSTALLFTLKLVEPVLITQVAGGDENSATGMNYIPGSVIRGALIDRYLRKNSVADPPVGQSTRGLFFDGSVVFLNAYPDYLGTRMLPTPLSWFAEKDSSSHSGDVVDDAFADVSKYLEQPKSPKGAQFCVIEASEGDDDYALPGGDIGTDPQAICHSPAFQMRVHIALPAPNVRTQENQVYRYESLAAGQVFAGAIVSPSGADLAPLEKILAETPELDVGGARSAGYGRVLVQSSRIVAHWEEYAASDVRSDKVVVTLLSDAILRGANGQVNGDMDETLSTLLGKDIKASRKWQRSQRVGGYNRKWSLPLPHDEALKAGSVFVYSAQDVDAELLRDRSRDGIGERRAEGFGRIAVNWQFVGQLKRGAYESARKTPVRLSNSSEQVAVWMAQRHLQNQFEQGLVNFASSLQEDKMVRLPSRSQLARIRNLAQQALDEKSLDALARFLKRIRKPRNRGLEAYQQLHRARLDANVRESLLNWLQEWVDDSTDEKLRSVLLGGRDFPKVAGVECKLKDKQRAYYSARVIDVAMKKAIRALQAQEKHQAAQEVTR